MGRHPTEVPHGDDRSPRNPDGRNQHHPAGRRDAGPAGDLHARHTDGDPDVGPRPPVFGATGQDQAGERNDAAGPGRRSLRPGRPGDVPRADHAGAGHREGGEPGPQGQPGRRWRSRPPERDARHGRRAQRRHRRDRPAGQGLTRRRIANGRALEPSRFLTRRQRAAAITARYPRTVASRPAYSASENSACPIDTSATSGTPRRNAPRFAWLRSWPALTPSPAARAARAAAAYSPIAAAAPPGVANASAYGPV